MPSASSQKQIPLRHRVISTQMHTKAQGSSMHHDEPTFQSPHHHQPQHSATVKVLATTLWPQQTTNYWFPNWRELFHGFTVAQGGQTWQAATSSFEQNGGATCTQQHARSSPLPYSSTQCLHLGTNGATRSPDQINPFAQHQQISPPLTSSGTHLPHPTLVDTARLPHPGHDAAKSHMLPLLEKIDQAPKGDGHITCPSSSSAPDLITKYTIKSPFWLPQGWVTEIQLRGTSTTPEKYYKHLVSGRQFRSKKDVIHFVSTGKGRVKKRERPKKALALAASHSLMNNFAHKKYTAIASKPFSQSLPPGSSDNKNNNHVGIPLLLGPNGENGLTSKQSICFSATTSIWGPESSLLLSEWTAQEKPQKLAVKKKAKMGNNKQTSNPWKWFKQPGVEKASEMTDERNANDLSLKEMASQRTVQLGRDIQAAHKTVVQISREMQATAEKLSREIQEAQKGVEFCSDLKPSRVPEKMQVALIDKTEACRDTEATPRPHIMTGSVVPCTIATNNLPRHGKWPDCAARAVSLVVQKPNDRMGILKQGDIRIDVVPQATNLVLNAVTQERSPCLDSMSHATQPAVWPDVTSQLWTQPAQMAYGSHATMRTSAGTSSATAVAVAPIHLQRSTDTTVGNVALPVLWPGVLTLNAAQPSSVAGMEKARNAKSAERCRFADGHATRPAHIDHTALSKTTQQPRSHVVTSSQSTQPAPVDGDGMANVAKAVQRQRAAEQHLLTERPANSMVTNAPVHIPSVRNALGNVGEANTSNLLYTAQLGVSCEEGSEMQAIIEEMARRSYQERKARHLRRKKFAAVLNPKLDLSRLNPTLTARQRAKAVQRMKTRHARELLATLGLHLCRKAIRRSHIVF